MTAMTSEREAFEKWARQIEGLNLCQVDGRYTSTRTRCAWNAWNRRSRLSQPAQAVDVEWSDAQCRAFIGVALRNVDLPGERGPCCDDIRRGIRTAALTPKDSR